MLWGQFTILGLFWLAAVFYVAGPHLSSRFGLMHWAAYHTPWKRKRMQRDFSKMLAVLLDAGMPEAQAVTLAADCTANKIFQRRAERAAAKMSQGVKLTEAVQALDDAGEFQWRLTNACHAHGGFLRALTGWCEALDAKAYQQEQSAALTLTSALVVLNGLFVCLIALAVFGSLAWLIESAVLW
jgi:type II secretory pathway component PulF